MHLEISQQQSGIDNNKTLKMIQTKSLIFKSILKRSVQI
jgi:hypothetical protein